jgi:protein-S-isoprenylcysteine O-methyltransferase Ste14
MSAQTAVNILWAVWYVTWLGAVVWSGKTQKQMKTDMAGLHRYASGLGALLLFWPSSQRSAAPAHDGFWVIFRRLWDSAPTVEWSLFTLVVVAFAFCWWARLHLGALWSGFVTLKAGHRIVDTGPYGLVRHPIYTGVIFAASMTAIMRASPAAFAGFALIAVGFSWTARIEEVFLTRQLGAEAYDGYRRRVGMLVPGLKGSTLAQGAPRR